MSKYSKFLIGGGVFLVACIVAYFITNFIMGKSMDISSSSGDELFVAQSKGSTEFVVSSTDNPEATDMKAKEQAKDPEIFLISKQLVGNTYNLQVVCTNVPEGSSVYYQIDAISRNKIGRERTERIHKTSNDGSFSRIPGSQTGEYVVKAYDSATNKIIASKVIDGFEIIATNDCQPVQRMSLAEFQRLLLNQNDNSLLGGKNPRVAQYVRLSCVGLREGDYPAGDIQHVRDKIANGIWKTAQVTSVGYDDFGKINAATIRPVYEDED